MKNTLERHYDFVFNDFINKLTTQGVSRNRQSVLDSCHKIGYIDTEDREVTIYYRVANVPNSPQTDECSDAYIVEQVKEGDNVLPLPSDYREECENHLWLLNPMQIS